MPHARTPAVPADWYRTLDDRVWLASDHVGEQEARFIRAVLRLRRGQLVLDAPCGAGRVAFHLAVAGCQVTGLDLRRQFLDRARRRFRRAGVPGRFRAGDLRDVDEADTYHGIYNWGGSFGYFSEHDNAALVGRFARALRPGGRLLVEQVNRERILRAFEPRKVTGAIVHFSRWDRRTQRLISTREVDGVRDAANASSMRLYTPAQLQRLLQSACLEVEGVYGFPGGGPLTRGSRRMAVVARKPPARRRTRPA